MRWGEGAREKVLFISMTVDKCCEYRDRKNCVKRGHGGGCTSQKKVKHLIKKVTCAQRLKEMRNVSARALMNSNSHRAEQTLRL